MHELIGRVQNYAWGSRRALAELTGRDWPTALPEAELWFGAHESAPSSWEGRPLDTVIAEDPASTLGADLTDRWQGRLPFLLKVLAPAQALSIQCHPTADQALDAPEDTYPDQSPKPEAVLALTPFELFGGVLPHSEIVARLSSLGIPELQRFAQQSRDARDVLAGILTVPHDQRAELVARTIEALNGSHAVPDVEANTIRSIERDYPGDIGLIVLLTMRHRVLAPGSYAFVPAGVLHVYLGGVAVEILANSDNVVRAGLTPKKVDVTELLRIIDVDRQMTPETGTLQGRVTRFPVSTPQFALTRVDPGAEVESVKMTGPRIVLAIGGSLLVGCDGESLELAPGESTFLTARQGDLEISGPGTAYVAAAGNDACSD